MKSLIKTLLLLLALVNAIAAASVQSRRVTDNEVTVSTTEENQSNNELSMEDISCTVHLNDTACMRTDCVGKSCEDLHWTMYIGLTGGGNWHYEMFDTTSPVVDHYWTKDDGTSHVGGNQELTLSMSLRAFDADFKVDEYPFDHKRVTLTIPVTDDNLQRDIDFYHLDYASPDEQNDLELSCFWKFTAFCRKV
eukprot:Clim_evm6s170 gene=Clim_evmTU6s170